MKDVYINGIVLDGSREMKPRKKLAVFVEEGKITGIKNADCDKAGYHAIDLAGQYLMPGLINLHVHLPATGKPKKKQSDAAKLVRLITSNSLFRKVGIRICQGTARMQLLSGVTTIRTVGGVADFDTIIRDRINEGRIQGPRILASNMAVSVPGGHMAGSLAYEAHGAWEARDFVRKIASQQPDLIKLMITGGVLDAKVKGEPGVLKMPAEYVKAACEEAHKLGFSVAAHVESPEGVRVALENGVDTIEHGAKPDAEILKLFHEKKASLVTTLSPALPYALFDRSISHVSEMEQYNGKVVFEGIIDCAKACLASGIPVGLGTDTGCAYVTHYNTWRELQLFHTYCGVSNAFALYTATRLNAQIAGIGDETGSIELGKCADFVVTRNNPLENLQALEKISMVTIRGQVIREPKVKKIEEVERELNPYM